MFYAPLPRTLEAALRDVQDPKVQVRVSAAKDLVAHGTEARAKVVAALEKALSDSNGLVRAAAAEGLGALAGKEALSALLVAVEDEHQIVRQTAIQALGEIGDSRAQQRLSRALKDDRPEVRFQAVMAYPRVASSPQDAMTALLAATRDPDDTVAHIAFRMAEELTEDARGVVPEPILARAKVCLERGSPKLRAVSAVLLATAGRPDADAVLGQIVEGKLPDADPEDVAAAIELAGERGLSALQPALHKRAFGGLLRRDPFQWQARVALARLGEARAKKEILAELSAGSFERRTLAASAAGRARLSEARSLLLALRDQPERAEPSAVDAALALLDEGAA